MIKRVATFAVLGVLLTSAPAFAGKGGLSIGAGLGLGTGKGGLVGSLLGKTNAAVAVNVKTGKGGLLGALIGGKGGHGGHGHGGCGCR